MSVKNLFGALLNGATVYPFNVREEGLQRLVAWMIQERITVYHSVPSLFRQFAGLLTSESKFPALRLIVLGGEPVTKPDVEQYVKHFSPDCILVNMLGSTEIGTYRQYFIDKTTPITHNSIVPVGYAVEDKEIHLLDDAGSEASPGDIGEIAVKSRYLAVGHWRDPDATKAAFTIRTEERSRSAHRSPASLIPTLATPVEAAALFDTTSSAPVRTNLA